MTIGTGMVTEELLMSGLAVKRHGGGIMKTSIVNVGGLLVALLWLSAAALAAERDQRQVIDGVAIYFGILPAQLVRGHPPEHPERGMHGGAPAGENHLMVALFDDKTGARLTGAEVTATITGPDRFKAARKLEPMVIADSITYGNYFNMLGPGPYRIELLIRLPGAAKPIRARFGWARP